MNSSNMSLDSLKKFWLQIISFFALIIMILLIIVPSIQNIKNDRTEIGSLETLSADYDLKIAVLKNQDVNELNDYLTNSLVALPSSYSSPTVLNSLEKLGEASGIDFKGLQASSGGSSGKSNVAVTTDYSTYNFSLSTSSDYAHAILMLKNFENTLPLFNINSISLRAGAGVQELSLSFSVSTYYKSLPEDIGTKSTAVQGLTDKEKDTFSEIDNFSNYPLNPDTSGIGKTNPFD